MQWTMQLELASITPHPPAFSKWLVNEQLHPHVAGNTGCWSSDDHTKGAKWGEAIIDSLVEQGEREEPATRPWSVLSVVDLTWRRVQDRVLTMTWDLQGKGAPMRRRYRGSNVAGWVEMECVGLHSAFPSSLLRQACI